MQIDQFIQVHEGKFLEVAGSANAKNQCVDLANGYIRDVWGLPIIEWTNAVDFPKKIDSRCEFIPNTTDGVPPEGSLVIFKKYGSLYGEPGHIALVLKGATTKSIPVYEQNYPTGKPCQKGTHNYLGCVGWIILKNMPEKTYTQAEWQLERDERNKNWNLYQNALKDIETYKAEAKARKDDFESFSGQISQKLVLPTSADRNDILAAIERLLTAEDQVTSLQKKLDQEQTENEKEVNTLLEEMGKLKDAVQKQQKENDVLLQRIADLEAKTTANQETQEKLDIFQSLLENIKKLWEGKK